MLLHTPMMPQTATACACDSQNSAIVLLLTIKCCYTCPKTLHATITTQTAANTFTFPINLHTHDAPKNVASHACDALICCSIHYDTPKISNAPMVHKMLLHASAMMPKHIACTYETLNHCGHLWCTPKCACTYCCSKKCCFTWLKK